VEYFLLGADFKFAEDGKRGARCLTPLITPGRRFPSRAMEGLRILHGPMSAMASLARAELMRS